MLSFGGRHLLESFNRSAFPSYRYNALVQFADNTQSEGVVSTSQSREGTVTEPQATVGRK